MSEHDEDENDDDNDDDDERRAPRSRSTFSARDSARFKAGEQNEGRKGRPLKDHGEQRAATVRNSAIKAMTVGAII